jgi:Skp family chaperone for outer membrane proteins
MEFRVVDFEKVTHHYKIYQDGIQKIEDYKDEIIEKVDPIRKQMQNILTAAQSGIVIDSLSEQQRMQKFQSLQQELVSIDKDAKIEITEMRDNLNKLVYSELEKMINDWSVENNIDIVIGKLEVVYLKSQYEITDEILNLLKSKGEFIEEEDTVEYKGEEKRNKTQKGEFTIKES